MKCYTIKVKISHNVTLGGSSYFLSINLLLSILSVCSSNFLNSQNCKSLILSIIAARVLVPSFLQHAGSLTARAMGCFSLFKSKKLCILSRQLIKKQVQECLCSTLSFDIQRHLMHHMHSSASQSKMHG